MIKLTLWHDINKLHQLLLTSLTPDIRIDHDMVPPHITISESVANGLCLLRIVSQISQEFQSGLRTGSACALQSPCSRLQQCLVSWTGPPAQCGQASTSSTCTTPCEAEMNSFEVIFVCSTGCRSV